MSFASKLQEIRVENNISQEGLAEMLGVSRQSVSKWERGKGYPEIDKLIFISERFGVSLDELLKEKKDASGNPRRTIKLTKDTKESDSVFKAHNGDAIIKFYRKGGKDLTYSLKVVGFTDNVASFRAAAASGYIPGRN